MNLLLNEDFDDTIMNYRQDSFKERLQIYLTPFDGRYEDLKKGNCKLNIVRDLAAWLVVAMVAIPLAHGICNGLGTSSGAGNRWRGVAGMALVEVENQNLKKE